MGSMKVKGRGKDAAEVPLREMSQLLKTIELYLNMRKKKKISTSCPGKLKRRQSEESWFQKGD